MNDKQVTWNDLSSEEQRIMKQLWDERDWLSTEPVPRLFDGVYGRLYDKKLIAPSMIKSGRNPEYTYRLTKDGAKLMGETSYAQTRQRRRDLIDKFTNGEITEEQFLNELEDAQP